MVRTAIQHYVETMPIKKELSHIFLSLQKEILVTINVFFAINVEEMIKTRCLFVRTKRMGKQEMISMERMDILYCVQIVLGL